MSILDAVLGGVDDDPGVRSAIAGCWKGNLFSIRER
jgi:hypothetical protein